MNRRSFLGTLGFIALVGKAASQIGSVLKSKPWYDRDFTPGYIQVEQYASKSTNTIKTATPAIKNGLYRNARTGEFIHCRSYPINRHRNKLAYYTRQWGLSTGGNKSERMLIGDKLYLLGLAVGDKV